MLRCRDESAAPSEGAPSRAAAVAPSIDLLRRPRVEASAGGQPSVRGLGRRGLHFHQNVLQRRLADVLGAMGFFTVHPRLLADLGLPHLDFAARVADFERPALVT